MWCLFNLYSVLTSQVTLTALEEMFQGARGIMNWLGDCAKVCCITHCTDVCLDRKLVKQTVMTSVYGVTYVLTVWYDYD